MDTHPDTVHKHLGRVRCHLRLKLLKDLHIALDHEIDDRFAWRTNGNVAHKCQILDETTRLAFRSFCRTDQTPVGVVKLARLCDLPIAADRCVSPTKM